MINKANNLYRKTRKRAVKIVMYGIIGRGLKILILGVAVAAETNIMTYRDMLTDLVDQQSNLLLPSYKYIHINYTNANTSDADYSLIQKSIFLGLLPNISQSLNLSRPLTLGYARRFLKKAFAINISFSGKNSQKIDTLQRQTILSQIHFSGTNAKSLTPSITVSQDNGTSMNFPVQSPVSPIFQDVYSKLKNEFLGSGTLSDDILIQGAIKGMTEAAGDIHTVYFPPIASQNFDDTLQGEFSGIGAYIDMKEPGTLVVSSPIENSPAERAGLKPGDQILTINDYIVEKNTDINDAIAKIKGPIGTSVTLKIRRATEDKTVTIVRDKIIVKPITTKALTDTTVLIDINSFSFGSDKVWSQIIKDTIARNYQTIIIDLRYNPGGSLEDVAHMLDYIVPEGEPTVIIRSRDDKEVYTSQGVDTTQSLYNKKVIVLINKDSASASEILAGVIRDYLPNAQIVGEKSYGKGSVQTLRNYNDGSSLKLTTAKWYTGKSDINIDGKGIVPDTIIVDNPNTETDEVIDRVKGH